ncbi:hypothetical protein ACQPZP_06010 [Spirillospora sp. CA-142024]|uniref:hypothetical protein n=1 Tax=Spirillospora sp. CA-142024 TaxID=3240036 RepID=UPI003D8E247F
MQCPTCGNDTPGTLGKCSHCEAPIDVYSVGPAVPMGAPVADTAPAGVAAEVPGDRTMMTPPPTPSWGTGAQPAVSPDLAMPPQPSPQQTAPEPPARPPLRLSVEPSDPTPAAASPLPPVDPEDTAAWTFNPDEDDSGGFRPPPAWGNEQPAPPAEEKAAPAAGPPPSNPFGLGEQASPGESIVPDSWFAQPRRPEGPEAEPTQVWGQQPPAGQPATMLDADVTQFDPGPGSAPGAQGFGEDLDRTRMDPGSPMGAPMGAAPLMGPMNQPPMGPGPMGPGQMGAPPMGPGMQPMGPMGPGDPAFGYPPGQVPPGPNKNGTSKPLIAAVAALVTVAAGAVAVVAWPSGGSPGDANPSPAASQKQVAQKNAIPPETKQQAATVNKLINDSVATRRVLAGALGRAGKCKTLPQAIQGFQTVAQRRTNQLNRTRALKVDKLANGERLRGSLSQALTASLQVDQVLLQWAQANQRKCKGKPRPSAAHVPGRAAGERRATTAKKQFVVLWNPVAKQTGQPLRSWKRV